MAIAFGLMAISLLALLVVPSLLAIWEDFSCIFLRNRDALAGPAE